MAVATLKEALKELYEKDFVEWVNKNVELLKEKAYDQVDWDNLIEEIEEMGNREKRTCVSYLAIILEHLYKWDKLKNLAGGEIAGDTWIDSIRNARIGIKDILSDYPSIKNEIHSYIDKAWGKAKIHLEEWIKDEISKRPKKYIKAGIRDNINVLERYIMEIPERCPYTYEETMNRNVAGEIYQELEHRKQSRRKSKKKKK